MKKQIQFPQDIASIPTAYGEFTIYTVTEENKEHVVFVQPNLKPASEYAPLVRIHSECFTGDTLGSRRCDCHEQLHQAMQRIQDEGGIIVYLRQEGRGVGLANKIKAYALQEKDRDTVEANEDLYLPVDDRSYALAAKVIKDLGFERIRLMTNNPQKMLELVEHGIEIVERIPLEVKPNSYNKEYLKTKRMKLGHLLSWFDDEA